MVQELTYDNFEEFTKDGIVLIDFFADWCMPCKMMAPVLDELSEKFKGKAKIGKVDVQAEQELSQKFNVSSIPSFVLFKDSKVVEQFVGSRSTEDFEDKINSLL